MKVLSCGEVLWDVFPGHRVCGGAPANFTFHASQFGAESAMLSALGQDDLGRELKKALEGVGIQLFAAEVEAPTGVSNIFVSEEGDPSYEIVDPSAWDYIQLTDEVRQFARESDLICFGSLAQRHAVSRASIREIIAIKKADAKVLFDVNLRQNFFSHDILETSLKLCNILKLNESELTVLEQTFDCPLEQWLDHFNLNLIILTLGERGSRIISRETISEQPVSPCRVVDAVGAGDSFSAAFVIHYLQGADLHSAQSFASEVAAYVCEHPGATISLPSHLKTLSGELSHEK